jgi:hypothetical protein
VTLVDAAERGARTADPGRIPGETGTPAPWCVVDLARYRNNVGITAAGDTGIGRFNIWRNSLPAEQLPVGRQVTVAGVPYAFPPAGTGRPDNVRCAGQVITVPPGRYDWVHVLAAAERRVEDEVTLQFTGGLADAEPLRISDFWAAPAAFGEDLAFRTSAMHYPWHVQQDVPAMLWSQRVPVTRRAELWAVTLPVNVAVHILALTLHGTVA